MTDIVAKIGGIFAVFTFIHFFVDWVFQSHSEAMVKHNNSKIRAKHCLIYTTGFVPILLILNYSIVEFIISINILFWSHFFEDTYLPVFYWAKYLRKPSEMQNTIDEKAGFIQFISTPLGKILMITIDQIIHLSFLFPVIWMAVN